MNWKIKDIELANISRFRGELMGAAMLFIILFHVALPREDAFYGLRRMGNVGVDMFLFLSGIGLWFSWMKNPSAKHFFIRLEIFWSRVPIFFIGINMGEMVRQKQTLDGTSIWMIWLMFLMTLLASIFLEQEKHGMFPLFLERMLYIPLTITSILLLNRIFRRTPSWFNKGFMFVGALSLECYLLHIHFVLKYIEPHHMGYWPTFFICIGITLPAAWILSKIAGWISKELAKFIK